MKIKTISIQLMMLLFCFFSLSIASYAGLGANEAQLEQHAKHQNVLKKVSKKERKQLKKLIKKPSDITKEGRKKGKIGVFLGLIMIVVGGLVVLISSIGVGASIFGAILGYGLILFGAFFLLRGLIRLVL